MNEVSVHNDSFYVTITLIKINLTIVLYITIIS